MHRCGHLMDGTVQQLTNFQFHLISYRNTLNYGTEEAHDVNKYVYYIIFVTLSENQYSFHFRFWSFSDL